MYASHVSLSSDFEVSCPELDLLVDLSRQIKGVYGCRMTGGGFGGCVVALVEAARAFEIREEISLGYRRLRGLDAAAFISQPATGAALWRG
jgi:galactokinase